MPHSVTFLKDQSLLDDILGRPARVCAAMDAGVAMVGSYVGNSGGVGALKKLAMLVAVVWAGVPGCAGSDLPDLGQVTGKVTVAGEPLSDAVVTFTPVGTGRSSSAVVGADGRYELLYTVNAKGALVGKHTVTITNLTSSDGQDLPTPEDWEKMSEAERQAAAENGITGPARELPPAAQDGSIQKEVEPGDNTIDIAL